MVLIFTARTAGPRKAAPPFVPGKVGQAMSVNGTNGISVPDNASLDFGAGADFSIDAWIKTANTARNTLTIVDKRLLSGSNVTGYALYLYNGKVSFELADGTLLDWLALSADLRDGQWHHIAVTVVRNSATGGRAYVDGAPTATFNPTSKSGSLANNQPLLIGQNAYAAIADYIGEIDEVELFSRAVTATDIASIYNAGSTGKCHPALALSGHISSDSPRQTVTPDIAPTNTTSINVSTSTNFKGKLEGNPMTGVVRVTDAHPAGTYAVTLKFATGGAPTTKMFTLTVTTPVTCAPVAFSAATSFGAGASPESVAVGDFNGDGRQDLAVANSGSDNVSILLGDGAGGFSAATNFSAGGIPVSVAVGDFNGDGKQDLAVVNTDSDNVSILLGNGAGSFGAATNFGVGSRPRSVAIGDFNGDGRQDLAVANYLTNFVSILLGDGAGGLAPDAVAYHKALRESDLSRCRRFQQGWQGRPRGVPASILVCRSD